MKKVIQEWIEIAEYDLRTAEAMLRTGRYLYVTFMCQQAVEKILKALYVQHRGEIPPRTHNLLYVLDVLKLDIDEKEKVWLAQLNQFYLESRYPGERMALARAVDKKKAADILKQTKEIWKCLKQQLRQRE